MCDKVLFTYPPPVDNKKSHDSVQVTKADSVCLEGQNFLNDNVISFYLRYVQHEIIGRQTFEQVLVFDSFFFFKIKSFFSREIQKQNDQDYSRIRKWFQSSDIFKKDFLVFPVCENYHWFLVIVCYPEQVQHVTCFADEEYEDEIATTRKTPGIIVLDSLRTQEVKNFTKPIRDFLYHEWRYKMNADDSVPVKKFDCNSLTEKWPTIPRQQNGYDCGIFILAYCQYFLRSPHRAYSLIMCEDKTDTEFCDDINKILNGQVTRNKIFQLIIHKARENMVI